MRLSEDPPDQRNDKDVRIIKGKNNNIFPVVWMSGCPVPKGKNNTFPFSLFIKRVGYKFFWKSKIFKYFKDLDKTQGLQIWIITPVTTHGLKIWIITHVTD